MQTWSARTWFNVVGFGLYELPAWSTPALLYFADIQIYLLVSLKFWFPNDITSSEQRGVNINITHRKINDGVTERQETWQNSNKCLHKILNIWRTNRKWELKFGYKSYIARLHINIYYITIRQLYKRWGVFNPLYKRFEKTFYYLKLICCC